MTKGFLLNLSLFKKLIEKKKADVFPQKYSNQRVNQLKITCETDTYFHMSSFESNLFFFLRLDLTRHINNHRNITVLTIKKYIR